MSTSRNRIPLVVVDDEDLFRDLVASSLGQAAGLEVVGRFGSAEEAKQGVPALAPRLALLDLDLGEGEDGVQLGLHLQRELPDLKVVLLSSVASDSYAACLQQEETACWSLLHKKSLGDLDALVSGLKAVASGLQVIEPALSRPRPLGQSFGKAQGLDSGLGLSDREQAMLRLLSEGASNQALATHFCLSEKTIEGLLAQLYRRLNIRTNDPLVHSRVRASWCFHQQG